MFTAFASEFGLPDETALKIAAPFGGGMGRMGEVCGAVTGAFMVIGLKYGGTTTDSEAKKRAYDPVREFSGQFKARHGSIRCRELLGLDIGTAEGLQQAREQDLITSICLKLARDSVEILSSLLE